jgi:prepilin-type N-terminal cleavage/methylation domain-containing protein
MRRLLGEHGWTMIEMQLVLVITGILATIAGPQFLDFMDQANKVAASANIRGALPDVELYYLDHGTYWGLVSDARVSTDPAQDTMTSYCIYSTVGTFTFYKRGPASDVVEDVSPGVSPCA